MSNYIYGFLKPGEMDDPEWCESVAAMRNKLTLGFHEIDPAIVPKVSALPDLTNHFCFCLSDNDSTLLSTSLIFEADWADGYSGDLPRKLKDRIALIAAQVSIIFRATGTSVINLWISECDQLEEVVAVPLSSLFDRVYADFMSVGIPCKLYVISR